MYDTFVDNLNENSNVAWWNNVLNFFSAFLKTKCNYQQSEFLHSVVKIINSCDCYMCTLLTLTLGLFALCALASNLYADSRSSCLGGVITQRSSPYFKLTALPSTHVKSCYPPTVLNYYGFWNIFSDCCYISFIWVVLKKFTTLVYS